MKKRKIKTKKQEKAGFGPTLDPEEPGLDEMTRKRRRALAELEAMSPEEIFQALVHAGICTKGGRLTKHYRDDGEPSAHRPTD